jgi:hypothetical protein
MGGDPVKPGYKTTEFWLTLVAVVLSAVASSGLLAEGSTWVKVVGVALAVLATLGYTASRAVVKKGNGT